LLMVHHRSAWVGKPIHSPEPQADKKKVRAMQETNSEKKKWVPPGKSNPFCSSSSRCGLLRVFQLPKLLGGWGRRAIASPPRHGDRKESPSPPPHRSSPAVLRDHGRINVWTLAWWRGSANNGYGRVPRMTNPKAISTGQFANRRSPNVGTMVLFAFDIYSFFGGRIAETVAAPLLVGLPRYQRTDHEPLLQQAMNQCQCRWRAALPPEIGGGMLAYLFAPFLKVPSPLVMRKPQAIPCFSDVGGPQSSPSLLSWPQGFWLPGYLFRWPFPQRGQGKSRA